jgi:site-specific recombinase XerD
MTLLRSNQESDMSTELATIPNDTAPSQQEALHGALVLSDGQTLDRNPAAVYLAGLAHGSRRTMRAALQTIAAMIGAEWLRLDWAALRFQHTAAIRARLAEAYSPATANKMLSALRGTLKAAWQLGQMSADDFHRAAGLKSITGSALPAGRALTAGEIAALLEACAADSSPAGARDAAMLALLRVCGLRRAELCALTLADFNAADGSLSVIGKRSKQRLAYVTGGALEALTDWLAVRGTEPGPLFCPVNKGGRVTLRRMHAEAVFAALHKRAAESGVKDLSPHDLRRTFAGDLLDSGADIATVQRLMGHANVNTTARYDRRGEQARRRAVEALHVPYRKRRNS